MPIAHLSTILVEDRQREDYGDLPELATSLADPRFGQLQPVVVNRDNRLLAGGRRLAAAAMLAQAGKTIHGLQPGEVWIEYKDTLSPEHAEAIELEENVRRKQLEWQEEQKAIAKLHAYRQKDDPTWTADKTAAAIGASRRTVFNAIELSKAVEKHPDIAKADTAAGAMLRLNRLKDLQKREDDIRVAALARDVGMKPAIDAEIIYGDALEGMKMVETESVDAVIFNPPFGVDIESLFTSGRHIYQNDGALEMTDLVEQVIIEAYRVLKPDRWMVVFYPTARLEDMKGIGEPMWKKIEQAVARCAEAAMKESLVINKLLDGLKDELEGICAGSLRQAGFSFQQVPCQWIKPNKRVSSLGDPYAQVNINYETFYFARKGKAQLRQIPPSTSFIFDTPGVNRIHPLEMPVDLWKAILAAICVGGERVVEPFAGSGSGGEAAITSGLHYTGWELDQDHALHGQTRLVGVLNSTLKPKGSPTLGGGDLEAQLRASMGLAPNSEGPAKTGRKLTITIGGSTKLADE